MVLRRPLASSLAMFGIAAFCSSPVFAAIQTPSPSTPSTTPVTKSVLPDAEKEQDIRQLITLTGGDKMGQQMMDQMIPEMQKILPQIPADFWVAFRKKTKMSELTERLLPVYDKYYSKEDVKGLIQFYRTPLGQKVISTTPGISRDSQAIGSAWGQEIAQDIIRELKEKEAAKPSGAKAKPTKAPANNKPRKTVSR
ncbi:MAG: DUF2059 domain-containing protein [Armatimonadota bacterium]